MDKYTIDELQYRNGYEDAIKMMKNKKPCEYCFGAKYSDEEFRVTNNHGQVVKVRFSYCPNCGRDLKYSQ